MTSPRVGWVAGKAVDLVRLDYELFTATELSMTDRWRLFVARYVAMARGSHVLPYLGRRLHYDNRLMPALMPSYLGEIRRLDNFVNLAGASVLDVGANIGQFAATVSWRFPGARIWSFEPNREIYPLLERNSAQSGQWWTAPWGVGERDEIVTFWVVPGKSGQGSVIRDNATANLDAGPAQRREVQLAPLDADRRHALGIPTTVDLVKIDVEGAEAAALVGLRGVQWRYLLIETSLARTGGLTVEQTVDLVTQTWGRRPVVRWRSSDTDGRAATVDALLEMPDAQSSEGP